MIIEPDLYTITRGDSEDLNAFLNSDKIELGGYASAFVVSDDFKVSNSGETINIRLVGFDKDLLTSEILSEIENAGYKLPDAEDAIWFGIKHPEVQCKFPIAFLHEPWIRPETGGKNVLILRNYGDKNYLHMHLFDSRWYSHIRFAVIEKNK
jgi:hypothetical protein